MKVVRIWEGLGNQMFQYAYARALREQTGEAVYLEGRRIYRSSFSFEDMAEERKCHLHHFKISLSFVHPRSLQKWRYLEQRTPLQKVRFFLASRGIGRYLFLTDHPYLTEYHPTLVEEKGNAYVMGHFLHRKYFEQIRELLLEEFVPKTDILLRQDIAKAMRTYHTVSVHIRRGDYLYAESVRASCKEMKQRDYYRRAMEYLADYLDNPIFLLFSDDMEWIKENFPCPYPRIYVSDGIYQDYEELTLMSLCQHNIIANSTFSFWGAWLNQNPNKLVIAPKHWMPSIIPKGWIQI